MTVKSKNKKFIYLISPNKIINKSFYNILNLVFKSNKVKFFQLRLKKESIKKKIIIIGAGIAGLAAAMKLSTSGINVEVYEQHEKPGGKIRYFDSKVGPIDAGPTVLTMYNVFADLFHSCGYKIDEKFKEIIIDELLRKKFINEKLDEVDEKYIGFWRNAVWVSSGWLWWVWLSHDVANIAVYLPRQLDLTLLLIVMAYFTSLLFYIFYIQGGPIQKVVLEKTGTRYARSATIINVIYAAVLFYFKELNDLPMSTTWVFVGLLCGRELAISTMNKDYKFKYVFPLIGKDFLKMIFGLSVSVGIVLAIHYIIIPNNWF